MKYDQEIYTVFTYMVHHGDMLVSLSNDCWRVLHCVDEVFTGVVLQCHLKALSAGGQAYWDSTQIATHVLHSIHLQSLVPCLLLCSS